MPLEPGSRVGDRRPARVEREPAPPGTQRRRRQRRAAAAGRPRGANRTRPRPVTGDHPDQRRPGREREREVARRVSDVERDPACRERQVTVQRLLAAVADHRREVEQRSVGEPGAGAGDGEAEAPEPAAAGDREPGAGEADQPPARHLPGASTAPGRARCSRQGRRAPRPRSPGAAPSAYPVIRTMSVVATTFGIGARTSRPATASAARAATSATNRAGGRVRSYQAKPPTTTSAEHRRRSRPASSSGPASRRAAARHARAPAPRSGVIAPPPPRIRATSVAKYQPPERISSAGPSAITLAVADQHHPAREPGGELDVVGRDDHRRAGRGQLREPADELPLRAPVHPAGGLIEATSPGGPDAPPRPAITIASASRCRSPPERSRGSRVAAQSSPTAASARAPGLAGELLVDSFADQHVARALRQQHAARRGLDRPPRGLEQPGRGAQEGALAGPVSAHQSDPLARPNARSSRAARLAAVARVELDPQIAGRESRLGCPPLPAPRRGDVGIGGGRRRSRREPALGEDPPRVLDGHRQRLTPASENSRAAGGASSGAASSDPVEEARRAHRRRRPAPRPSQAPGRRPRGSARAGARRARTAIPHSSFRRRSSPISSSPATGSSCEVGSSSRTRRGRRTSAAASATRCSSPPERVSVGRSSRCGIASASATSSTARARAAAGSPRSSSGSSSSAAHRGRDHLGLGVLGDQADARRRAPPGRLADVEAGHRDRAPTLASVEVRHEAAAGPQQRRLARPRATREDHELPLRDLRSSPSRATRVRTAGSDRSDRERRDRAAQLIAPPPRPHERGGCKRREEERERERRGAGGRSRRSDRDRTTRRPRACPRSRSRRSRRPAAANRHACRERERRRGDRGTPLAYPRSSSAAATSTARSSDPATSRRASAGLPTGAAAGTAQPRCLGSRAWSAAASGTSRVISVAVSAERRASGRSRRSTRSGSTHAEWTAKAHDHDRDPQADASLPRPSASALTSTCPSRGSSPSRDEDGVAALRRRPR